MSTRRKNDLVKGLVVDLVSYLCAFCAALIPFFRIENLFAATAALTATATLVLFVASIIFSDVSIYDPYWSIAPPVMVLAAMLKYSLWNINAILVLALVLVWSFRLTANWLVTYQGLGHEDWRYARYRKKYPAPVFQFISFCGLHFVPTIVVYAGLTGGLFAMQRDTFAPLSVIGILVMLGAVLLEFFADRAIHKFLHEHAGEGRTCNISVWKYSRHPNYLGEILFWAGLYIYFVALCPEIWYMGLGFLSILLLFLVVSIPLMERHNMERRADYAAYKANTSMLLLLPNKRQK